MAPLNEIKLSLSDVNPAKPILQVLRRPNNVVIYFASGKQASHWEQACSLLDLI